MEIGLTDVSILLLWKNFATPKKVQFIAFKYITLVFLAVKLGDWFVRYNFPHQTVTIDYKINLDKKNKGPMQSKH